MLLAACQVTHPAADAGGLLRSPQNRPLFGYAEPSFFPHEQPRVLHVQHPRLGHSPTRAGMANMA